MSEKNNRIFSQTSTAIVLSRSMSLIITFNKTRKENVFFLKPYVSFKMYFKYRSRKPLAKQEFNESNKWHDNLKTSRSMFQNFSMAFQTLLPRSNRFPKTQKVCLLRKEYKLQWDTRTNDNEGLFCFSGQNETHKKWHSRRCHSSSKSSWSLEVTKGAISWDQYKKKQAFILVGGWGVKMHILHTAEYGETWTNRLGLENWTKSDAQQQRTREAVLVRMRCEVHAPKVMLSSVCF